MAFVLRRPAAGLAVAAALALAAPAAASAASEAAQTSMTATSPAATEPRGAADPRSPSLVLQDSAVAWTRGDLDTFMACYEDEPETTYLKADGVVRGYAAIRAMYAPRFADADVRRRGRLSTEISEVRPLGADYALVIGRFRLARAADAGGDAAGVFTLVFHRGRQGWRIVSDHTS